MCLLNCYVDFEGESHMEFIFYLETAKSRCNFRIDLFYALNFRIVHHLIYLISYSSPTINIFTS